MSGQLFGEEARRAWEAAGGTDYNKQVAEGKSGFQSTNPSVTFGSGTGSDSPWAQAESGGTSVADTTNRNMGPAEMRQLQASPTSAPTGYNPNTGNSAQTAANAATVDDDWFKNSTWFSNPGAAMREYLKGVGVNPDRGSNLFTRWAESKASMVPAAYMLKNSGNQQSMNDGDFLGFLSKLMGGGLGAVGLGNIGESIRGALGSTADTDSDWGKFWNNFTSDRDIAEFVANMSGLQGWGNVTPFQKARQADIQYNAPERFTGEMASGRLPKSTLFWQWLKDQGLY